MRLAPLLLLLPAFALAQDVPSLQRASAALPITESVAALRTRLGGPGGPFAAAQLALKGRQGADALFSARTDADPLVRLDAAFGLGLAGDDESDRRAAWFLGDSDPRVVYEAEHGLRLRGRQARRGLRSAALGAPERAADRAAELLMALDEREWVWRIAHDPVAKGRGGAIRSLDLPFEQALPVFLEAARDPRPTVRFEASRRVVFGPKGSARTAALDRLSRDPRPAVRLSLARAMDEDPGSVLDAAYERASRYGAVGSRRAFARMVGSGLYDPARLRAATAILGRLSDDPSPAVATAAVQELYRFVEDRLGGGSYGSDGIEPEDVPWDGLSPTSQATLRRGVGRRLGGPLALEAAVVLARLHDRRAYPVLASAAFGARSDRLALIALGALGDRRATPRLLERLRASPSDEATYDALQRLRDPAAIPALLEVVRTGTGEAPIFAAQTVAVIGDRAAAPALIAIARSSETRTNLYFPLAQLGGPEAVRYLLERLEGDSSNLIQYATLALGDLRDPSDVAALRRFAASASPRAVCAKQALETVAYRAQLRLKARSQGSFDP